ncbi:MAG: ribosome biogenesis GTPase Der [Deltaproteobacteria bacterium]|nr:ribosome biogenesis GTPase Der [Deltaproteobacteria bacterium]
MNSTSHKDKPVVAIVGRPNVGKSRLFNRFLRRARSIVDDMPGVTRDRIYADAVLDGDAGEMDIILVDTGGFDPGSEDPIAQRVLEQTQLAIDEADVIIFLTDGRAGVMPEDEEIARRLRRGNKTVVLAVNKIDGSGQEALAHEFHRLAFSPVIAVSASHGRHVGELEDLVIEALTSRGFVSNDDAPTMRIEPVGARAERLAMDDDFDGDAGPDVDGDAGPDVDGDAGPDVDGDAGSDVDGDAGSDVDGDAGPDADGDAGPDADGDGSFAVDGHLDRVPPIRVAVIGRPNSGKSSLINCLIGEDRHLVSAVAGTTVDSVDSLVQHRGQPYLFIDTAGIRRKRSIALRLERFSVVAALKGLERSDVALLLLDGTEPVAAQDAKVAAFAYEKGKAVVLVVSKWDLARKGKTERESTEVLRSDLKHLSYAPIVFTSAHTGFGTEAIFPAIQKVHRGYSRRVSTGQLNRFVESLTANHSPPTKKGKRGRIYYMTQIDARPPRFLVSVNDPELFHFSYRRFLVNELRRTYGFFGAPVLVGYRDHRRDKDRVEHNSSRAGSKRRMEKGSLEPARSSAKKATAVKRARKKADRRRSTKPSGG